MLTNRRRREEVPVVIQTQLPGKGGQTITKAGEVYFPCGGLSATAGNPRQRRDRRSA